MRESRTLDEYLDPAEFIDSNDEAVKAYAYQVTKGLKYDTEKAVELFYAVRDDFKFDLNHIDLHPSKLKASALVKRGVGTDIEKSTLLAATARAVGIPSRVSFSNLRSNLTAEQLGTVLQSDLLVFHSYTELWMGNHWVKLSPAFNQEACDYLDLPPLDFGIPEEKVFEKHHKSRRRYLKYVHQYGSFADLPYDLYISELRKHYPHLFKMVDAANEPFSFDLEFLEGLV
ncbi:MAG TPA: transglutaminase [Microscillaceae bacterium]|nr:transglutaminase [Microscillaceae bacterium]